MLFGCLCVPQVFPNMPVRLRGGRVERPPRSACPYHHCARTLPHPTCVQKRGKCSPCVCSKLTCDLCFSSSPGA